MSFNKKFFAVLLLTFALLKGYSQFPNPLLYTTGSNAAGNSSLPYNAPDLNWQASITGSIGTYVQARVCGKVYNGWSAAVWPNGNWISYPHTCSQTDIADHTCLGINLTIWYKLIVNLPCADYSSPGAYGMTLTYFADNGVQTIWVNGVLNYTTTSSNPYSAIEFNSPHQVNLTNGWAPGSNTVLIQIDSAPGAPISWEGLMASFTSTANTTSAFSATATSQNVTCNGYNNGTATVTASSSGGALSYIWTPPVSTTSVANNLAPGNYSVTVMSSASCSLNVSMTITEPPGFNISVSKPIPICRGHVITMNASGAQSYTWMPTGTTGKTFTFTATVPTAYTLSGSDANGCITHTVISIQPSICDGIEENYSRSDVILDLERQIIILPEATPVRVYDYTGREVFSSVGNVNQISLETLPPGCYFMWTDAKHKEVLKFIKPF